MAKENRHLSIFLRLVLIGMVLLLVSPAPVWAAGLPANEVQSGETRAFFDPQTSSASRAASHAASLPEQQSMSASNGSAFLSIPAAAFIPMSNGKNFQNHGRYLKFYGPAGVGGYFTAAVLLPHGARVLNMKACFYDDSASLSASMTFQKTRGVSSNTLVIVNSVGATGFQEITQPPYFPDTIDTILVNQYYVVMTLPISSGTGSDVWSCGVTLEYLPSAESTPWIFLPSSAFRPFEDGYEYSTGYELKHYHRPGGSTADGAYLAPVNLPNGSFFNKISLHIENGGDPALVVTARLQSSKRDGTYSDLADVECQGAGENTCSKDPATWVEINNSTNDYWVLINLPATVADINKDLSVAGVSLDYRTWDNTDTTISISNAAFTPYYSDADYANHARWLYHYGGGNGVYVAPVFLPQGATLTAFKACFYADLGGTVNGAATLVRTRLGVNRNMASVSSTPNSLYTFPVDDSILSATIDNSQYAYFVYWNLPVFAAPTKVVACGMQIDYGYFTRLPLVLKNQ